MTREEIEKRADDSSLNDLIVTDVAVDLCIEISNAQIDEAIKKVKDRFPYGNTYAANVSIEILESLKIKQ